VHRKTTVTVKLAQTDYTALPSLQHPCSEVCIYT